MGKTQLGFAKARRQSKPSAAARRLIDATKSLLETRAPGEITTTMMLEEAGVARNTLYLHFEDQTALLEVALLEVFVFLKSLLEESRITSSYSPIALENQELNRIS